MLGLLQTTGLIQLMIDLLKTYKELKNAPGYVGSLRYYIAKKKIDTLFVKWLSSHQQTVEKLLQKAQKGQLKATQQPNPLFSHHKVPSNPSNLNISAINLTNTITPPRSSYEDKDAFSRKSFNETQMAPAMIKSTVLAKSISNNDSLVSYGQIPQFFFPRGKPMDLASEQGTKNTLKEIAGNITQFDKDTIKQIVVKILGLPNYFSNMLVLRCTNNLKTQKITRVQFNKVWKELECEQPIRRAFWLLSSQANKKYMTISDFQLLFKQILDVHPGLEFLKETPEFQEWYSLCVIHRMFYMANRKYDYKMTFRQFKKSRILKSLFDIEAEPDINRNADFFSYEDFYVIYIRFWQLDNDHDFQLSRQQLSKYSGYTLSRKTIQRIFSQSVKKFQHEQKMGFGDFVWFILCVQDKTTEQSIEYWFKIIDLDGNGIITGYELQYFFEEQSQRLSYMESNLDFNFQNIVCQMVDLFKPQDSIQFTMQHFLSRRLDCSVFINMLTDLNKLINFEQRDAYEERNQRVENPNWSEWDRFVKPEYKRIQSAQENDEGGEVLNWEQDD